MASLRPTFMFNGQPVRAAGILIYTFTRGRRVILLRDIHGRYEDIGGKTDLPDQSFVDTAVREACEETNGKLFHAAHERRDCENILRDLIDSENCEICYNLRSKYVLFKIHVHPGILKMNMKRFGIEEKTDWGILRHYYRWKRYIPKNIHPRLYGLI